MKRALTREQLKFEDSVKFQDAYAIMDWCYTNISTISKENSTIWWLFWLVEENNITIHHNCETINGSRNGIHLGVQM